MLGNEAETKPCWLDADPHERLYFKGTLCLEFRRQAQRWGESKEPSRWQRLHQLSRSGLASPRHDQIKANWAEKAELRELRGSRFSRSCPASTAGSEMGLTFFPPSEGGVVMMEEAQGHRPVLSPIQG